MTLSYTKNLHLAVPDFLTEPWHGEFAQAMDSIDEIVFHALIAADVGPWLNNTHYAVGALVINPDSGGIFSAAVEHNSSPPPTTFSQEKVNHPDYWQPIGLRLATQEEAELGVENSHYMSPLRVQQAINAQSTIAAFTTGDVKTTFKAVADPGWIMANDGTIGDDASGASRANLDTEALFILFWNGIPSLQVQTSAGVNTARGASANADYANHRRLVIPKMLGRALAGAGAGSGLPSRALGFTIGAATITQSVDQMPNHTHPIQENPPGFVALAQYPGYPYANQSFSGPYAVSGINYTAGATGGGLPMNIMNPTVYLNFMIKL